MLTCVYIKKRKTGIKKAILGKTFTKFKKNQTSVLLTSISVLPVWPPTSGKGHPLVVTAKLDAIRGLRAKKISFHPLPAQTNTVIKSALAQTSRGL